MCRIANSLRATVPAPPPDNRPTVPAPAYAACRAAALRAELAHEELLLASGTGLKVPDPPADLELDWSVG